MVRLFCPVIIRNMAWKLRVNYTDKQHAILMSATTHVFQHEQDQYID